MLTKQEQNHRAYLRRRRRHALAHCSTCGIALTSGNDFVFLKCRACRTAGLTRDDVRRLRHNTANRASYHRLRKTTPRIHATPVPGLCRVCSFRPSASNHLCDTCRANRRHDYLQERRGGHRSPKEAPDPDP